MNTPDKEIAQKNHPVILPVGVTPFKISDFDAFNKWKTVFFKNIILFFPNVQKKNKGSLELFSKQMDEYIGLKAKAPLTLEDAVAIQKKSEEMVASIKEIEKDIPNDDLYEKCQDENNIQLADTLGHFYFMSVLARFELSYYSLICFKIKDIKKFTENLLDAVNSMKMLKQFYPSRKKSDFASLKNQLINNLWELLGEYHPNWLGFKELSYHIERKNQLSIENKGTYHGHLIYDVESQEDLRVMSLLVAYACEIKDGKKPTTQCVADLVGKGHANAIAISYNKKSDKVEFIFVESTNDYIQYLKLNFLCTLLKAMNISYEIIAIQAGLQINLSSCYTYALAISSQLSKTTFAEIKAKPSIDQPAFKKDMAFVKENKLDGVTWKHVTVLGEKVVMMDQSTTNMSNNLKQLYPNDMNKVQHIKDSVIKGYALEEQPVPTHDDNGSYTYIHYYRDALRKKYKAALAKADLIDINLPFVISKAKAKDGPHALRVYATGFGPLREFKWLVDTLGENTVNTAGGDSLCTPLHWAYKFGNEKRAKLLIKAGADEDKLDKNGKKPKDYKKIQLI